MELSHTVLSDSAPHKVLKSMKNFTGSSILVTIHMRDSVDYDMDMKLGFILMDGIDSLELFT